MKTRLLFNSAILLAAIFIAPFSGHFNVRAQGGDAKLTPDPKPAPTPKGGAKTNKPNAPATPAAPVTPTLVFNQELKGKLDSKTSDKGVNGGLFEDHILNAKSEDLLTFQILSANTDLGLQILDKDKNEVPVAKDAASKEFKIKTPSGGLPADGEYRVRVTGAAGRAAVPFSLKVNRLGLLVNVYNERLNQIYTNFRDTDPASVDETVTKLEELAKADTAKSSAFEFLGIIYLYNKRDFAKAEQAMEQAIKLNGAAVVKISFDAQWRRMARVKSGNFDWEDARTGWIRIRPGQMALTDPANRTLATVSGSQIKELSKILTPTKNLVTVTGENARRPFIFAPGSGEQAEADLVIKLIQTHVMGKTN